MTAPRPDPARSPWHAGEQQMQRTVGAAQKMAKVGPRVLRSFMPEQHRDFFAQLPMVVLGTVDQRGRPWASIRDGYPGFIEVPDETHLVVRAADDTSDPARFGVGDPVGVLGIEFATRRRNRANGRVAKRVDDAFVLEIEQSFGNCPRYISPRRPTYARDPAEPATAAVHLAELDEEACATIRGADTFFVASFVRRDDGTPDVDVSHRGGPVGFVEVSDRGTLTIPDYAGNHFFNTLGNFVSNPVAGLLFVDFDRGDVLQLCGTVELLLDSADASRLAGAERVWRFEPRDVVRRSNAVALSFIDVPTTPPTGR